MRDASALLLALLLVAGCKPGDDEVGAAVPATADVTDPAQAEAELRRIQDDWGKALIEHDTTFFENMLAHDMTVAGPDGAAPGGRDVLLRDVSDTSLGVRNMWADDMRVRLYHGGTVGVVTGVAHGEFKQGDRYVPHSVAYTETFVKEGDHWLAVAAHYSTVPEEKE